MKIKKIAFALIAVPVIAFAGVTADKAKSSTIYNYSNSGVKKIELQNNEKKTTEYKYTSEKCKTDLSKLKNSSKAPGACGQKVKYTKAVVKNNKDYATLIYHYTNGKASRKEVFNRTGNMNIASYHTYKYYSNGHYSEQNKYYGGKKLKADSVVYNKQMYVTYNRSAKVTRRSYYRNVYTRNGAKRTVRYSHKLYNLDSKNRVTNIRTWTKDVKTNLTTKSTNVNYNKQGKRTNAITTIYNNGKRAIRHTYTYNKSGQLKSNKHGDAFRKTYKYTVNGKRYSKINYKYTTRGKLHRA